MAQRFEGYELVRQGRWRLWVNQKRWQAKWWATILRELDRERVTVNVSRHAVTSAVSLTSQEEEFQAFFKVYRAPNIWQACKNQVRMSKPLRAFKISRMLAGEGLRAPGVIAVGEERRWGILLRAFLLTEEVRALGLQEVAQSLTLIDQPQARLRKRRVLSLVGSEVAKLHNQGYVHGDLVVTNILVSEEGPGAIWFIDHDRSQRPWRFLLAHWQRRNLVQLNRIELPMVTNTDRLRAFSCYARVRGWGRQKTRREARLAARRTRLRRLEIEEAVMHRGRKVAGYASDGKGQR